MKTKIIFIKEHQTNSKAIVLESRNDDGSIAVREWLGNKTDMELKEYLERRNLIVNEFDNIDWSKENNSK